MIGHFGRTNQRPEIGLTVSRSVLHQISFLVYIGEVGCFLRLSYRQCKKMHFIWCLVSLLATIVLSLLPFNKASFLAIPARVNQKCYLSTSFTVICHVQCFEDIGSILPPEANRSLIQHLIVQQRNSICYPDIGLEVLNEFTNLRQLHYTGALCPFSVLPNLTNFTLFTLSLSTEAAPSREEFIWTNSTRSELPQMKKLAVNEICCGLFQGTVVAPVLNHLVFRCSKVSSYVSGVNETRDKLVFVTPALKTLEYMESSAGFPVSSVSNLPHLETLIVTINTEFSEDRVLTSKSLNLSSLSRLVFSQGEFGNIFGLNNYQCMELGDTNLNKVVLMHPPKGSTTCPSIWRCASCIPSRLDNLADAQVVQIFIRSSTSVNFSSLLPNETLNTTHLTFNHAPLLLVDGEAMRRFSQLQMLHVGEVSGSYPYNGVVKLMGNPFKALPRPQIFQSINIALPNCGCKEYDIIAWLKAQNPNFGGFIQCLNVPETSIAEERIPINMSISVKKFLKKLSGQCVPTPVLQMEYNSTIGQFVFKPMTETPKTSTTTTEATATPTTTETTTSTISGATSGLLPATTTTYAILFLSMLL